MLSWFARDKKNPGWLAISLGQESIDYVHANYAAGGKSSVSMYGSHEVERGGEADRFGRGLHFNRYRCTTMLAPGEYQMLLVEAPTVPPAELKSAMRWRIKDMIDYHVDDAAVDVLEIPADEGAGGARTRMMYAVAAHNDVVQERVKRFERADIPLSVIDIPEICQRNIAALHEEADRGVAMLYFGEDWGLLTINYRAELYLGRRLEVGVRQLAARDGQGNAEALDRVVLEFQRTLDHFERQFRNVPVSRLLIAPMPQEMGVVAHMRASLGIPVEAVDLRKVLGFAGAGAPDEAMQWRLFHHFGAALRHETRAL